jgi:hypothetical protein
LPYVSVPPIERAHPRRHHGKHSQKMCECSVQLHSSRQGEILQRPLRGHSRQNGNCLQMWPHKLRGRRVAADFVRAVPDKPTDLSGLPRPPVPRSSCLVPEPRRVPRATATAGAGMLRPKAVAAGFLGF